MTLSETHPRPYRLSGLLLLAQFVLMWAAFFILMPAINWPASLGEPPAVILPLILEQAGPVFAGYTSYLLHALLLIPLAVTLRATLKMSPIMGTTAVALGVLAGLAKALGITRWLFLMPGLAVAYTNPEASEATRDAIAVVYEAFNAYAGGLGELLGVGLFAGVWTVLISVALVRLGGGARLIGLAGFIAAAGLFSTLPSVVGIESPILLTLSGIVWQIWTAVLAVWHFRARA
ncbi:MAG: DUF4386 family protein [Rhodobacteraceae bacterium]|nr:DUF4386 family protein [Paracoccaceae bacterium]